MPACDKCKQQFDKFSELFTHQSTCGTDRNSWLTRLQPTVTEPEEDPTIKIFYEAPEVIFTVGSGSITFGHDHYNPFAVEWSVITEKPDKNCENLYHVGQEASKMASEFGLVYPVVRGKVVDWSKFMIMVQLILDSNRHNIEDSKVVYIVPPYWEEGDIVKLVDYLFDLKALAVCLMPTPIASFHFLNVQNNEILVDIGYGCITASRKNGNSMHTHSQKIDLGFSDVVELYKSKCNAANVPIDPNIDRSWNFYVPLNGNHEDDKEDANPLGRSTDALFQAVPALPSLEEARSRVNNGENVANLLIQQPKSVYELIYNQVLGLPTDLSKIVIHIAGWKICKNLPKKMEMDLEKYIPSVSFTVKCQTIAVSDAWLGAQLLYSYTMTPSKFILREDYTPGNVELVRKSLTTPLTN